MTEPTMGMLARVVGGVLHGGDARFNGVGTDSRALSRGALFVALRGPKFDGHDFVADAVQAGAAGVLVERPQDTPVPQVITDDTRIALGHFAKAWRVQYDVPVVGLTGSNGKTTTKEMAAAILEQRGPVLATRGNLNNDIGVPLTLLRMDTGHASAVIEMGANHPGEITYLTELVVPTVGLVTNAGPSHLEGFGSVEGVARAKGELFEHLPEDACAVVNLNDDWAGLWRELAGDRRVVGYGVDIDAEFSVSSASVEERPGGGQAFSVDAPGGARRIEIPVAGRHNLRNALAAIAVAITAGANGADAVAALARFNGIGGRMTPRRARNGAALIDDSYNANPASLKAAVDVLAGLPGRRWLVLGDMGELGDDGANLHREAGEYARHSGIERLFALGTLSREAADAFGAGAEHFDDVSELSERVAGDLSRDVTVLVKGSRGMKMERIVSALGEGE